MMNIRNGQGFRTKSDGKNVFDPEFGLIVNHDNTHVMFVRVTRAYENGFARKAYDDPGAIYERDRHNVRLKDCPPPFQQLGKYDVNMDGNRVSNSIAIADLDHAYIISRKEFEMAYEIVDGGRVVSERDMQQVLHHPWPIQKEKQLNRRLPDLSFLDVSSSCDDQFER